jgi:hypothetical protein
MNQALTLLLAAALAGCAAQPPLKDPSPCAIAEASYECQVERYQNVSVP